MGRTDIELSSEPRQLRSFMKKLLNDLRALEKMLKLGLFEKDIRRIGAEQEFFMVNDQFNPTPLATEVLEKINDRHFTTELARFNLEINLDPEVYSGHCLANMEAQLETLYKKARKATRKLGGEVVLAGILPTIRKSHLVLDNITPFQRYYALNNALLALRGEDYELRIKGIDELTFNHSSVMLEACNTSFQVHFQVAPDEFTELYNCAQLITGPVLAAATNSPVLLGKRLWHETRIALFQQAVDTRGAQQQHREREPRVWFGNNWVKDSVLEIYREDISRFRVLFGIESEEDPFEKIKKGEAPSLEALGLHTGTIYRWNRPCYGISNGKPHLRIENRVIPAGPTTQDAIANMAFFFGLMSGFSHTYPDVSTLMDFDHAKHNFYSAAHLSLNAQFRWIDGKTWPARDLILKELLPIAHSGLAMSKVDKDDATRFLNIIEERVQSGKTGSFWVLNSFDSIKNKCPRDIALSSITSGMIQRQKSGKPVHLWSDLSPDEILDWNSGHTPVEQLMNTNLFTVHENDLIDLVADMMHWQKIRHIAVENLQGKLVGLVSYRHILRQFGEYANEGVIKLVPIKSIMNRKPVTLSPHSTIKDVVTIMREQKISAIPIVDEDRLVGMVSEQELFTLAASLFDEKTH